MKDSEWIDCACGCGEKLPRKNKWGQTRKFINHHYSRTLRKPGTPAEQARVRRAKNKTKASDKFPKEIKKHCNTCDEICLHRFNCSFFATGEPEYRCVACIKKSQKKYRKNNRKELNKKAVARKKKKKEKCIEYMGGKCQSCDYVGFGREMTFHHLPGVNKLRDISQMLDWSWEKIQQELDKCVMLCFRCHMQVEERRY